MPQAEQRLTKETLNASAGRAAAIQDKPPSNGSRVRFRLGSLQYNWWRGALFRGARVFLHFDGSAHVCRDCSSANPHLPSPDASNLPSVIWHVAAHFTFTNAVESFLQASPLPRITLLQQLVRVRSNVLLHASADAFLSPRVLHHLTCYTNATALDCSRACKRDLKCVNTAHTLESHHYFAAHCFPPQLVPYLTAKLASPALYDYVVTYCTADDG